MFFYICTQHSYLVSPYLVKWCTCLQFGCFWTAKGKNPVSVFFLWLYEEQNLSFDSPAVWAQMQTFGLFVAKLPWHQKPFVFHEKRTFQPSFLLCDTINSNAIWSFYSFYCVLCCQELLFRLTLKHTTSTIFFRSCLFDPVLWGKMYMNCFERMTFTGQMVAL